MAHHEIAITKVFCNSAFTAENKTMDGCLLICGNLLTSRIGEPPLQFFYVVLTYVTGPCNINATRLAVKMQNSTFWLMHLLQKTRNVDWKKHHWTKIRESLGYENSASQVDGDEFFIAFPGLTQRKQESHKNKEILCFYLVYAMACYII
ncbi:hypothetical protein KIL84_006768 [Mauremys mutica]|uniref:Uncharacterized protein n=1 Tax=Mauremys mutica TaxID=74926 RepID=A0A9D4AWG4_9SAUR|nr:hypothetical protein KIL84_006768 [Mauremys mutica]